ncbi:MAG TPA: biotin/lipoyl-containing protein, partial [Actinomycetota bacterium]|nr:biotin/lipoyl-containing protein [Actinomycetota bacterium]
MATPVTMPQLGETVVEGTITKWLKREGEHVDRDEPLFEISTDKVDTEVPSPLAGTITEIKVPEGDTVEVGTELAMIDEGGGAAAAPAKEETPSKEETPEEAEPEQPQGEAPPAEPQPEPEPAEPAPARAQAAEEDAGQEPAAAAAAPAEPSEEGNGQVRAGGGARSHILSPLVRRLADEHGIDLSQVQGTGTGGRITKSDVMAFVEGKGQA